MMNGKAYRRSLADGRTIFFEGERVEDIGRHPLLGHCVDVVAADYDRFYDPSPGAISPLMSVPRSGDEIRKHSALLNEVGLVAHVSYTSVMTLITAAGRLAGIGSEYGERLLAFVAG